MAGEATFPCAVCGAVAGQVRLLAPGQLLTDRSRAGLEALADVDALIRPADQAVLVVDTFYGVAAQPVSASRLAGVAAAVDAADAATLYALGYSYAPFHCPECEASYCGEHWAWRHFDDGEFNGIEGRCPSEHFHVLSY